MKIKIRGICNIGSDLHETIGIGYILSNRNTWSRGTNGRCRDGRKRDNRTGSKGINRETVCGAHGVIGTDRKYRTEGSDGTIGPVKNRTSEGYRINGGHVPLLALFLKKCPKISFRAF